MVEPYGVTHAVYKRRHGVAAAHGGRARRPRLRREGSPQACERSGVSRHELQYCHASKLPKKDTFKRDELNERGKWLAAEKDKQKAKTVSVDWLKGYPGSKEQ
jgi:hypothetical protein